jgi:hypothetical protein
MILMGIFYLFSVTAYTQASRVRSGTPLRWSMNSSVEIMEGDLTQYYGSSDSSGVKRNGIINVTTVSNPHALRFSSVQAQCNHDAMMLNWTAVQQPDADRYEVEQSDDNGASWRVVGTVLARQTQTGESAYTFHYNKNAANSLFRIAAVTTNGARLFSSLVNSPCGINSYLSATPNPVYSTTTVRIGSPTTTKLRLMLVDTRGVVVQKKDVTVSAGTNSLPVDMSNLVSGYYTLAIQWMGGRQDVINLVKQ